MSNNKGYGGFGASTVKRALRGLKAMSTSPIEDIDNNNLTLRQRGRLMYMGSPIATSAIKTSRTNTVGTGLRVNPRPDADALGLSVEEAAAWSKQVKKEFGIWANRKEACDATGMNNFYEIQQMLFTSWLTSGDVFALIAHNDRTFLNPYSIRIKAIEADRCATKNPSYLQTSGTNPDNGNKVFDGVEIDKSGAPVAYWFRNSHPFESTMIPTKWQRVEAYGKQSGLPNVLHIVNTERPDQYRGVSILAPVIEQVLQISRYSSAEVMAAVIEAMHTGFVKTTEDPSEMPFNEIGQYGEEEDNAVRYDPEDYHLGAGEINVMNPGESIEFPVPTRPSSGFEGFVKAIASQIGAALEIPRDILLKEFNASYSASRGALLEAWKSFKMYRTWFVNDFCNPIYEVWLSEAIALGRINAPGFFNDRAKREAWLGTQWIGPSQGQLDPVKEINAEILACEYGFSTYAGSALRINGSAFASNIDALAKERKRLEEVVPKEEVGAVNALVKENARLQALIDELEEISKEDNDGLIQ